MEIDITFQELTSIDQTEWNNIPMPLIKAIRSIKSCLFSLQSSQKTNNEQVSIVSKKASAQLESCNSDIASMQNTIASTEINLKKKIKEISETVSATKSILKTNLLAEVDYMKKNYDGKLSYLDTQLKQIQNTLKILPRADEVENMIRTLIEASNRELEPSIKEDVKTWLIAPEIRKINEKFAEIEEYKISISKNIDLVRAESQHGQELLKEDSQEKFFGIKENADMLLSLIEKVSSEAENQNFKINQKFSEFLKKNKTQLDTLNLSLNSQQERLSKSIKDIQKQHENIMEEIFNVKESFLPSSPSMVYEDIQSPVSRPNNGEPMENKKISFKKGKKSKGPDEGLKNEIESIKNDLKKLRGEIDEGFQQMNTINKGSQEKLAGFVDRSVQEMKIEVGDSLLELREKLKWLPMNLKEISGMNPSEARIFILEARIRSEENVRSEQITKLINMIDHLKIDFRSTAQNFVSESLLPNIQQTGMDSRASDNFSKDYYRIPSRTIKNSPTTDRLKLQLQRNPKTSMSVDLQRIKNSKRETLKYFSIIKRDN